MRKLKENSARDFINDRIKSLELRGQAEVAKRLHLKSGTFRSCVATATIPANLVGKLSHILQVPEGDLRARFEITKPHKPHSRPRRKAVTLINGSIDVLPLIRVLAQSNLDYVTREELDFLLRMQAEMKNLMTPKLAEELIKAQR